MKKGILVTEKNIAMIFGRLKKVISKKKFLSARSFYTRDLNKVKQMQSLCGDGCQALFDASKKCIASRLMLDTAGVTLSKNSPYIWLNSADYGYLSVRPGNKVFISGNNIYIERTDYAIKRDQKFIMCVS
ncbi:hypothetical protein C4565_02515 [Candidatus Parcubacteria bacterium]|jgi:hypothetical protein|nr:MAG: hypothetical protein C4565_02515 [Candidatus Parcubacteria bacterium]